MLRSELRTSIQPQQVSAELNSTNVPFGNCKHHMIVSEPPTRTGPKAHMGLLQHPTTLRAPPAKAAEEAKGHKFG